MSKNTVKIPVNSFASDPDEGITIDKLSFDSLPPLGDWEQPERHDRHSFFLLEKGSVKMEIDFQVYDILSPSLIYMHPDQVHRIISFNGVDVYAWAMANEWLDADLLPQLEDIAPTAPVLLDAVQFELLTQAASLMMKLAVRKNAPLYHPLVSGQGNTLVALATSFFLERSEPSHQGRKDQVTKAFRKQLNGNFAKIKSPADYARALYISTTYLNECVKSTTGQPVSHHIRQRVVLEAKRQLYHSNLSLKEIAASLGYDDYPYFSRLFTKLAGNPPTSFRKKNRE